jgi:glutathione S-transferase
MLLPYENDLSRTKYLIDNKIQLVDMAIFPFIRQFANVDRIWFESRFPNIERWLEEFIQSKLFKRVMIKYKPWCQGDNPKHVIF